MTNLIAKVAELRELAGRRQAIIDRQKESVNHALLERLEIESDLLNAAPGLLAVAEQFHPGDSDSLESALIMVEAIPEEDKTMWPNRYKHATDCLRRMLAAAKIMEGNP